MKTQQTIKSLASACAVGAAAFLALVIAIQANVIRAAPDSPAAPRTPGSPEMIHYQGRLSRVSGAPVPDTISVTFSIYNQPAGGMLLWSARYDGVTVTRGVFNVMLGGATPFSETGVFGAALFADDTRYLEVTIITSTLSPRQRIGSVAYALAAKSAISAPWSGLTGIPPDLADGDSGILTVTAGTGLTGGGSTPQVTLALQPAYQLPQFGCTAGEYVQWTGSAWVCATLPGAGDITGVYADGGLVGGGASGGVTITLPITYRLPASCASGQIAEWNGSAWLCDADDNTTYSAGPGLTLNVTTFQVISAPVAITSTTAWRADLATNATTATYAVDGPFVHRLGPDAMTSASPTATFSLNNLGFGSVISATSAGPGDTIVAVAGPGVAISATSKTNVAVDALTGTGLAAVRGQNPLTES